MHIVNPDSPPPAPARRKRPLPPRNRREIWKTSAALQAWRGREDATGCGSPALKALDLERGRELQPARVHADAGLADRRKRLRDDPGADQTVRALTDNLNRGAAA